MSTTGLMTALTDLSVRNRIPLRVHFDLTYLCNERCVHCYLEHEAKDELTLNEAKRVLDQLKQTGTFFLTFSGGEIFLRKDLWELLAHARQLHFDVSLKSNGTLIDDAAAAELKRLGVRCVHISIYSARSADHDAVTNLPGSWLRSIEAVRFLRAQGLLVKLICPLMKQNAADYQRIVALASELQVSYSFDPSITQALNGDMGPLGLRIDSKELTPILADPIVSTMRLQTRSTERDEADIPIACREIPCSAGHNSCYISPCGEVYPCVQLPISCGNLRQKSFAEIWTGAGQMLRVAAVRESSIDDCSCCSLRKYCERCPGLAEQEQGSFAGPSERACQLAEIRARLAGAQDFTSAYHRRRGCKQT